MNSYQVLNELLLGIHPVGVGVFYVGLGREHQRQLSHRLSEQTDEHLIVVGHRHGRDLRQAL